jgi:YVTN family beta-propeller protein
VNSPAATPSCPRHPARGRWILRGWLVLWLLLAGSAPANVPPFINFETAPVHPLDLGPDGRTLALCNLPDNRVEFFDVASGQPVPSGSVPVGLDPVTARFASSNELWVVNHISSSISIIDVAARRVVATLDTPAGPADVVFAGTPRRAWVSCARTNAIQVIDPVTRLPVATLAIAGDRPTALAASPDGSRVYAAIFESGNGTTVLGQRLSTITDAPPPGPVDDPSGPYGGQNPPPNAGSGFSPALALTNPPPRVAHLVRRNNAGRWLDDNGADWTEWVSGTNAALSGRVPGWDLPDRDLAILDTATLEVSYAQRLMNICMALGVNPVSGEIAVVGTEAFNERRFEPVLNGVFLEVRLALVDPVTRTHRRRDLNPHLDYVTRTLSESGRALSLGDPRGIVWTADGTRAYVTGMGSRNLVVLQADGTRARPEPVELGEGPTGLALDEPRGRLYVWNRFSSSLSVVDTAALTVVTNVPVFDPTPPILQRGRRHLYDTRRTSGLGHVSCASCHVDARWDRLAWDLGNPAGSLSTNLNNVFHPMKGPMMTQTLQDIITPTNHNGRTLVQQPLHWRGDKRNLEEFNHTFTTLQSAPAELTTNELAEFKALLASTYFPPNFRRTFSNSLPTALPLPGHYGLAPAGGGPRHPLPPGNAQAGWQVFSGSDCRVCHGLNQGRDILGTTLLNLLRSGNQGAFKSSQLRSLAEKVGMDGQDPGGRSGFGYMHDGTVDTLTTFLVEGFPDRATDDQAIANLVAFMLCFSGSDLSPNPSGPSQDVPAAAGRQVTWSTPAMPPLLADMHALALRTNSRVELVVRGPVDGTPRHWLLRRTTGDFQSDRHGETVPALATIAALAGPGREFTATLVPQGSGVRLALDRDGDGYFDTSEAEGGHDAANPASRPGRLLAITPVGPGLALSWEAAPGARYTLHWSTNLPAGPAAPLWTPLGPPLAAFQPSMSYTDAPPAGLRARFYRLRLEPEP